MVVFGRGKSDTEGLGGYDCHGVLFGGGRGDGEVCAGGCARIGAPAGRVKFCFLDTETMVADKRSVTFVLPFRSVT